MKSRLNSINGIIYIYQYFSEPSVVSNCDDCVCAYYLYYKRDKSIIISSSTIISPLRIYSVQPHTVKPAAIRSWYK